MTIATQFIPTISIDVPVYQPGIFDPASKVEGVTYSGELPNLWIVGNLTQENSFQLGIKFDGSETFTPMISPLTLAPGAIEVELLEKLQRSRNFPFFRVSGNIQIVARLASALQVGESLSVTGFVTEEGEKPDQLSISASEVIAIAALVEQKVDEAIDNLEIEGAIGDLAWGLWNMPPINHLFCLGQVLNKIDFPDFWDFANNWESAGYNWDHYFHLDANSFALPSYEDDFFRVTSINNPLGIKRLDQVQGFKTGMADHLAGTGPYTAFIREGGGAFNYSDSLGPYMPNSFWDAGYGTPRIGSETYPKFSSVNVAIRVK